MTGAIVKTLGLGAVAALAAAAAAAQAPTADQILDTYVAAIGGRAAIEKITSATAKGTIEIEGLGISGTVQVWQKAPNKGATRTEMTGIGLQRDGFDGTAAWAEDPQNGLRDRTGAELADVRRSSMFPRELKLKTMYPTMTVTGRERVGARAAYVIEATPADGPPTRMFFDVESGLLLRQMITRQTLQGPIEVDVVLDDYRDVDGVKRPFRVRQITASFTAVIQFTEVVFNLAIDEEVFRKPR
jgi:outer membrane lipoprotein-sorting protein